MLSLTFIDFYVFWAIIPFITVDMVDYFAWLEWSAEDRFSYHAVFWSSVEFSIGFAFSFVKSCFAVCFVVSIFRFPACRVALGI